MVEDLVSVGAGRDDPYVTDLDPDALPPDRMPNWARQAVRGRSTTYFEATYTDPRGRRQHFIVGSEAELESIVQMVASFDAAESEPEEDTVGVEDLDVEVRHAVDRLSEMLAGHDALDVMSRISQYLMPPDMALWTDSGSQSVDSWACAEIVALVLLGEDLRECEDHLTGTADIVPDLVDAASKVLNLAQFAALVSRPVDLASSMPDAAIGGVARRLRGYETAVRGRQYVSVGDQINDALLRRPNADPVWRQVLGFGYLDVLATRDSLVDIVDARRAFAFMAAAAADGHAPGRPSKAVRATPVGPSTLFVVTVDQVATQGNLDAKVVEGVLDAFSLAPDGRTGLALVQDFVDGRNPMAGKGMIKAPGRGYLVLPGAIAIDEIRRTAESQIAKDRAVWPKYGKGRDAVAEALVAATVSQLVQGRGELHRQLHYRATARPGQEVDLSATSTNARQADSAEADALLVLDGVALCVEVKAGAINARSRQGRQSHLRTDLKETVQKAASQADRLRTLIVTHQGLWLEDGGWLDLPDVREVYSVVVTLDDLGPAVLDIEALVRGGVLPQTALPWIVSVHDLMVIAELLDRPEQFLAYLRRRTNRDAALWVSAVDELDIAMWFVDGGFYFEPDPDRLHRDHPGGRPPTAKDRRAYAEQGRTMVGTLTDPLDAWYYHREGSSWAPADRPTRRCEPFVRELTDWMSAHGVSGWWRTGADLESYSDRTRADLAARVSDLVLMSRSDGGFHTFTTGGVDDTGRWLHVFATGPDTASSRGRLEQYLQVKKHQEWADRAMAFLLNPDGTPCATLWMANPPSPDAELDRLAREMRLVPPARAPRVLPPHAKPGAVGRARRKKHRKG